MVSDVEGMENYFLEKSLNPCCNGRWSLTYYKEDGSDWSWSSLNPCCNGRWSLTFLVIQTPDFEGGHVLILVVMEDGL